MTYLENLREGMIAANAMSRTQYRHNAWGNKKTKTRKRMSPRGRAFLKLEQMEHVSWWDNLTAGLY